MLAFSKPEKNSGLLSRFIFISTLFFIFSQGILLAALYLKTGSIAASSDIQKLASTCPVFIKLLQLTQSITIFLLPALVFTYFSGYTPSKFFPCKKLKLSTVFIVFLFIFISVPFVNSLVQLNKIIPFPPDLLSYLQQQQESADALVKTLLEANKGFGGFILDSIVIAVVPAIAEEFFFRGALQQIFHKMFKNIHIAILLTAFIFSFIHFQFLTFIPRFYLGIILGYIFYWSGNIWTSITAHFFNNLLGVFAAHILPGDWQTKMETVGSDLSATTIIINFLVIAIIFYAIKKHFDYVKQRQ